jgi:hypothetical protein
MDKAWAVNNSMVHEPHSTQEETEWLVNILDSKYEKADLQLVLAPTVLALISKTKTSYWGYS